MTSGRPADGRRSASDREPSGEQQDQYLNIDSASVRNLRFAVPTPVTFASAMRAVLAATFGADDNELLPRWTEMSCDISRSRSETDSATEVCASNYGISSTRMTSYQV